MLRTYLKLGSVVIFVITFLGQTVGQSSPKLRVDVSQDTVYLGNYFQLSFTIENADFSNVDLPAIDHLDIIAGPNSSTSMSIINGSMSQHSTVTYYIQPSSQGKISIGKASFEMEGQLIETPALEIHVIENPDGIIQNPNQFQGRELRPKPSKKRKRYKV